ncbi:hypothetical protein NHX12_005995 [Muraenolepis orangiensis]|uniref:Dynein regulatory complex subunit 4 n=1 Tax=Muraenolepis orangiensis TaxID=630683 RepID=A0A9Q0DSH0_9TELE|nr:hypothetical protein NHX12_005995 [Muraenolepis orangiensis]
MPPKKTASKKATKGKTPTVIDGLSTEEMSKEQLEEHIVRLREELDREREERNYFQLEKDKVYSFWEIVKRDLEERKAELRNRDRETEEAEERHQVEIKVYKQKVKHLLYEHQNSISELKAEGVVSTKLMQSEHGGLESELRKGVRALKVDLREQELGNESNIRDLKLKHDEELTGVRNDFERQVREVEALYEKKMQALRQELDRRRKREIHEVEARKNDHISELLNDHKKNISEIKDFYSDNTRNQLAIIKTLKNKRLTEPLQRVKADVAELQKQLARYEKDKASLAGAKARLKVGEQEIKDLKWEHEVLEQRFTKAIQEVQQKSGFKNLLLERKLDTLTDSLEKKEAQLNEVLSASNMDQTALGIVTRKVEEVLDSKNIAIKDLQYELARTCKAHNDLLKTYEAKLRAFGIPVEELGFTALESSLAGQTLGQGPAGLVSHTK